MQKLSFKWALVAGGVLLSALDALSNAISLSDTGVGALGGVGGSVSAPGDDGVTLDILTYNVFLGSLFAESRDHRALLPRVRRSRPIRQAKPSGVDPLLATTLAGGSRGSRCDTARRRSVREQTVEVALDASERIGAFRHGDQQSKPEDQAPSQFRFDHDRFLASAAVKDSSIERDHRRAV